MVNKKSIIFSAVLVLMAGNAMASGVEDRTQASRAAVKEFFATLKGQLESGMKAGGPVTAIEVCNHSAEGIAHDISEKKGWQVARTSLKTRNPENAPDAWEAAVLESFEKRKAAGEDLATMEFSEVVEADGKKNFRFMKAIPTAEQPCLACHGEAIKPEVAEALDKLYPEDKARGYKAGDIRGAFTITQPME